MVPRCHAIGIKGLIVPDAFPEQSKIYIEKAKKVDVAPILLTTIHSSDKRIKYLSELGDGFLYSVARKGVTGSKTIFDHKTDVFLNDAKIYLGSLSE
ncbi:tryptophan synthase subunit alpha [Niallia circulans]|nr:hypothetical protein BC8716_03015 [Shouchella clausii]PAD44489.1 hypothetical protein CHH54_02460 [Bacillus sp. 7520-S]SPT79446.1 tryptophan synthase subunit alpha [Niallia circulans]PAD12656.1 hypothetical protein CHH74_14910 [Shouchella clausii]PAD92598.1 hypothetical protein CHH52_09460 [Shouchella clausii]